MDLNHLPNARPGEKVQLFLRRHWTTPLGITTHALVLFGLPLIAAWYFSDFLNIWLAEPIIGPIIIMIASIYFFGASLFSFMAYVDYYLDVWIVTNERIINIEQKGLFTRVASELHITTVEDTTSEVKGLAQTFLDYGNVHIQTAGERTRFIFKNVPQPERVKEQIIALIESAKKSREQDLAAAVGEAIK